MLQSKLFGKTLRENPAGEVSKNAILLERGGFVYKTMAGVYDYLPLGYLVLENINKIIREEMAGIGGQELFLSAMQGMARWSKTKRWSDLSGIMYRLKIENFSVEDHYESEIGLATTHEDAISEIAAKTVFSYKDLPQFVYQIQTKFRNEPRAKSGLIRGREFLMKDLYSFHANEKDLDEFYHVAGEAYKRIFSRCNLVTYVTEAPGGTFTEHFTHEYQVLSDAGEDWIFFCDSCQCAQNKKISPLKDGANCLNCAQGKIILGRSIEVGNSFKLGTKFSQAFGLYYSDKDGGKKPVVMGSYGIGPGRLMGTIVEIHSDEKGIIWPDSVSPYAAHLISLNADGQKVYAAMLDAGIDTLYDDRDDKTAGEKFADADLIGIPWRVVVSEKTLAKNMIEVKGRAGNKIELMPLEDFITKVKKS